MLNSMHERKIFLLQGIILLLGIFLICGGCASPARIQVNSITGYAVVQPGEQAEISWEFANADRVRVEGLEYSFNAKDSYKVRTTTPRIIKITAYRDMSDSLSINVVVDVNEKKIAKETQPKPEIKPDTVSITKTEAKTETKTETKPESKSGLKFQTKLELSPETKLETKTELKPEIKPEVKPATKPVSIVENKPESKPEIKPESKPEVKQEPKPEIKPEVKPEIKPESKPVSVVETKPEPISEVKQESKPLPMPEVKPEPKPEPQPQFGRGSTMDYMTLQPAYLESEYMAGLIKADTNSNPKNIKIMRTIYPYTNDQFVARAIVLDQFGNYLQGLSSLPKLINWTNTFKTDIISTNYDVTNFNEKDYNHSQGIDINIMLDNSAAAINNSMIVESIKSFLPYLSPKDRLMFSYFNQNKVDAFPFSSPVEASKELNSLKLPAPEGLNSLYKTAYTSVSPLSAGYNRSKVLIIITYNSDNSSIIYSANDLGKLAHDLDVPVYIIGVGSAMESYSLKYMTALTGGRFYHITADDIPKLGNILLEITFAQKGYYEFLMPLYSNQFEQNTIKNILTYKSGKTELSDKTDVIIKPEVQFSEYQALAYFNYRDTVVQSEFDGVISSLAKVLKDNPNAFIQLVGHSSTEGTNELNMELSLKRAQEVRLCLIKAGAGSSQIRVRAVGDSKPLYFLQTSQWQQQYNRRVTVRWLDPSILPYEIIAGESNTEDDALGKVEKWEERHYQVYYERYIKNNSPVYKIKLWGYATQKEADDTAKQLKEKFKSDFVVE